MLYRLLIRICAFSAIIIAAPNQVSYEKNKVKKKKQKELRKKEQRVEDKRKLEKRLKVCAEVLQFWSLFFCYLH
jgi:ribosomal protein L28